MASNGTFQSSQVKEVGNYPSYVYVNWSATQDKVNNKSTIKWECYGGSYYDNATRWTTTGPVVVKINGQTVLNKTGRFNMTRNMLLGSGSLTVQHNENGEKSVAVSISAAIYYGTPNSTCSGTIVLDTIPRASQLTAKETTIGQKCNIKWTPASDTFVYKIKFKLGTDYEYDTEYISPKRTTEYTYTGYTVPTSLYSKLPDSPDGTMTATLYTYKNTSSGTPLGVSNPKSFKIQIPSNIQPSIGSISLSPAQVTIGQSTYNDMLIQGQNTLTITANNVKAGTGSSILSYTFADSDNTVSITQNATMTKPNIATIGPVKKQPDKSVDKLTYIVTVKDKRKRSVTVEKTIDYYAYSLPSITLKVTRNQKQVTCTYKASYSSLGGKNSATVTIYAGGKVQKTINAVANNTTADVKFEVNDALKSYEIYAEITDGLGKTVKSNQSNVYAQRVINITPDGTGVAFGKFADIQNCVDVPKLISRDNVEITTPNKGYYIKNPQGTTEVAAYRNNNGHLWLGAKTLTTGHITGGGTYISTGDHAHLHLSKMVDGSRTSCNVVDTENYTQYLPMIPTVLYRNSSGTKGTIKLNANVSNYTYLEIFYCEDNTYPAHQSVRYSREMGSRFDISSIEATPTSGYVYLRTSRYNVSKDTMEFARSKYVTITSNTTGDIKTPVVTESTTDSLFKITKVIGYSSIT